MNRSHARLNGRRVLFLTWPFYEYPDRIKLQLEKLGANVDMYYSAPTTNFLYVRLLEKFEFLKRSYFKKIIENIKFNEYDYIFVINPAVFPEYFLAEMASLCKNIKKIVYSWDSLEVYPKAISLYKYFDDVYSFDLEDAKKFSNIKFLPLFYCDDIGSYDVEKIEYDFSFIGFGHTERYKFINKIKEFADKNGFSYCFKLYLPSKLHYLRGKYIKKIFSDAKVNDFIYTPISQEEMKKITAMSRVVVDLELSNQSGLTMRTIETLGIRKKLITTNNQIRKYDFYHPDNILVVDRNNPDIPISFVQKDYVELPIRLYQKYSLSYWIKVIFNLEEHDED